MAEFQMRCSLPANSLLIHAYIVLWLFTILSAVLTLRQLVQLVNEMRGWDERKARDTVLKWLVGGLAESSSHHSSLQLLVIQAATDDPGHPAPLEYKVGQLVRWLPYDAYAVIAHVGALYGDGAAARVAWVLYDEVDREEGGPIRSVFSCSWHSG